MDVNEKIVDEWARLCRHQFTMPNISVPVPRNYSDIDILAYDPKEKLFYDYEVKFRSIKWVGATPSETTAALVRQLLRPEREKRIRQIIGDAPRKKVFVTSGLMLKGKKENELRHEFEKNGIQILTFEKILDDLNEVIDAKGRYNSEVPQLLRMLKLYKDRGRE